LRLVVAVRRFGAEATFDSDSLVDATFLDA
jgi:hypothetical protein